MITVYQAHSSFDAKLIQDQLSFEGITAYIMGDLLQGGMGELQAHGLVKVLVDEENVEKSLSIIEQWSNTKISEEETIKKPNPKPTKMTKPLMVFIIVLVILGFYFIVQ